VSAQPDRKLAVLRSITRDPWVEEAAREISKPRRHDWKGKRQEIMVRLPEHLAEALRDVAGTADLSLSETAGFMIWAYLSRSGELQRSRAKWTDAEA
jgi:hypothetical protein